MDRCQTRPGGKTPIPKKSQGNIRDSRLVDRNFPFSPTFSFSHDSICTDGARRRGIRMRQTGDPKETWRSASFPRHAKSRGAVARDFFQRARRPAPDFFFSFRPKKGRSQNASLCVLLVAARERKKKGVYGAVWVLVGSLVVGRSPQRQNPAGPPLFLHFLFPLSAHARNQNRRAFSFFFLLCHP